MDPVIDDEVRRLGRILWDYHGLDLGLERSDFALAMGSHDLRVARRAAELVLTDMAPLLVASGGFGKVTRNSVDQSEGQRFASVARKMGVPSERIIVEESATNTGENIALVKVLLEDRGLTVDSGILVTKPYMRRRAIATAQKQWPKVHWLVTAPAISFDEYAEANVPEDRMIELMVGDLQRLRVYAEQGFQVPQEIPDFVWSAYEGLVNRGFSRYVIPTGRGDRRR